jgi:hypothetical protein
VQVRRQDSLGRPPGEKSPFALQLLTFPEHGDIFKVDSLVAVRRVFRVPSEGGRVVGPSGSDRASLGLVVRICQREEVWKSSLGLSTDTIAAGVPGAELQNALMVPASRNRRCGVFICPVAARQAASGGCPGGRCRCLANEWLSPQVRRSGPLPEGSRLPRPATIASVAQWTSPRLISPRSADGALCPSAPPAAH